MGDSPLSDWIKPGVEQCPNCPVFFAAIQRSSWLHSCRLYFRSHDCKRAIHSVILSDFHTVLE